MLRTILTTFLLFIFFSLYSQKIDAINLKCEYKVAPVGVESAAPKLSWELKSDRRNVSQTAYRIIVADNAELLYKDLGNVWDSKKVSSDRSIQISYGGKRLQPVKTYYWKVIVWDNKKSVANWSRPAAWQMGLFTAGDWKGAKW